MIDDHSTARARLGAATGRVTAEAATLVVAALAGVAGVAASYAVAGFTPNFVAGPIAGTLARVTPGAVISAAILVLGDLGHQLNLVAALSIAAGALAAAALAGIAVGRRLGTALVAPPVAAVGAAAVAFAVTRAPVASLGSGLAVGTVLLAAAALATDGLDVEAVSTDRRRVVGGAGAALAFALGGYALGSAGGTRGGTVDATRTVGEAGAVETPASALLSEAGSKSLDVAGLEPLVSEEFYEVDINATDPTVDVEEWTLTVTGAVEEEVSFTYDDITGRDDVENRFASLRCVGEGLNGKKLDTAVWTGVPIMDLIEPAGVPDTCCVMLRATDGFFEEFPLDALADGFLAFGMNGEVLPRGHGYPARALIPGHWGEINVKWIDEIEILEEEQDGYWEKRGWHGTGPVNTVAKLHVENRLDDGRMEVAGHAYAGTRGIRAVEVSTDGGDTWSEATLSEPLPGEDVWRQWAYRYDPPDGTHEVVVRATDGTGELQPRERSDAFPSGATGWVSTEITA